MGVPAVELKGITKTFGSIVANSDCSLTVEKGEILSVLGENGSGKTTLMNMLAGIYFPDAGQIFVNGEEVVIRSPKDAFKYNIGMIHQHFKLVDVFTATENIVLGMHDEEKFSLAEAEKKVRQITERYGFAVDLKKKIYEMSVSEKQTVEIIKVLYRGANILILDEPTNGLDPSGIHEIRNLIKSLPELYDCTVLISSHMLSEIELMADDIGILNHGRLLFEGSLDELRQYALQSGFATDNLEDMFLSMIEKDNTSRKQRAKL